MKKVCYWMVVGVMVLLGGGEMLGQCSGAFSGPGMGFTPSCVYDTYTNNYAQYAANDQQAGNSYSWSVSGGALVQGQGTPVIRVHWPSPSSGMNSKVITLTVSRPGCSNTTSSGIDVRPLPLAQAIHGPRVAYTDQCEVVYTSHVLSNVGMQNQAMQSSWGFASGTVVQNIGLGSLSSNQGGWLQEEKQVRWQNPGLHVVSHTLYTTGCMLTDTIQVRVHAGVVANATIYGDTVALAGDTVQYFTGNGLSYQWEVEGGYFLGPQDMDTVWVVWTDGPGKISVTVGGSSCSEMGSLEVQLLNSGIYGSDPLCGTGAYVYSAAIDDPSATYVWGVLGGTILTGQGTDSVLVDWPSVGNNTIWVTTTIGSVSGTDTLELSIWPPSHQTLSISSADSLAHSGPLPTFSGPFSYYGPSMGSFTYPTGWSFVPIQPHHFPVHFGCDSLIEAGWFIRSKYPTGTPFGHSMGLAYPSDADPDWNHIPYSFRVSLQNELEVRMGGSPNLLKEVRNVVPTDSLTIAYFSSGIHFFHNTELVYVAPLLVPTPFRGVVSGHAFGATVSTRSGQMGYFSATLDPVPQGLALNYQWYVNGQAVGGSSSQYFHSGGFNQGDSVWCEVTACGNPVGVSSNVVRMGVIDSIAAGGPYSLSLGSDPICVPSRLPVTWQDKQGVGDHQRRLTAMGVSGWGSMGAASVERVRNGMRISTKIVEVNTARMMGLSSGNSNAHWNTVQYGIMLTQTGTLEVREGGGANLVGAVTYVPGDVISIQVDRDSIFYYKNDVLLRKRSAAQVNPNLMVDVAFFSNGATLDKVFLERGVGTDVLEELVLRPQSSGTVGNPAYRYFRNGVKVHESMDAVYRTQDWAVGDVFRVDLFDGLLGQYTTAIVPLATATHVVPGLVEGYGVELVPTLLCQGDSIKLSVLGIGAGSPTFLSPVPLSGFGGNEAVFAPSGLGRYVVSAIGLNGCSDHDTLDVLQFSSPPSVFLGPDLFSCLDSLSLNVVHSGSQLAWSTGDSVTSIVAGQTGIYWVESRSAQGCLARDSVWVSLSVAAHHSIANDTAITYGDTISLALPSQSQNGVWQPSGGMGLVLEVGEPGMYSVVFTDSNGCVATDTVVVVSGMVNPVILPGDTVWGCVNDSVVLSVLNAYEHFVWSTGDTTSAIVAAVPGNYWVIGSVWGQNYSSAVVTLVDSIIHPTLTVQGFLLSAPPGYTYIWYKDGVQYAGNSPMLGVSVNGYYQVQITNASGCSAISDSVYIEVTVGVGDGLEGGVTLSPNPSTGLVWVRASEGFGEGSLIVWDALGKVVKKRVVQVGEAEILLDLSMLSEGVYWVQYHGDSLKSWKVLLEGRD